MNKQNMIFVDTSFFKGLIDVADEAQAWKWFLNDWSKLSFTDCLSFAVMKRLDIARAATFDEHFNQARFTLIN